MGLKAWAFSPIFVFCAATTSFLIMPVKKDRLRFFDEKDRIIPAALTLTDLLALAGAAHHCQPHHRRRRRAHRHRPFRAGTFLGAQFKQIHSELAGAALLSPPS